MVLSCNERQNISGCFGFFLDVFVLFWIALFLDENFILAKIFPASSPGYPCSSKRVRSSSFRNSTVSLTEFVLSERKVSPLIHCLLELFAKNTFLEHFSGFAI